MAQAVQSPTQPYTVFDVDTTKVVRGHSQAVARSPMMTVLVHRWESGGEVQLHTHPFQDATWTVLQGRVKFYGENDEVLGDLGPHQGIFIPGGTYYWFENTSDVELVMTRVSTTVPRELRSEDPGDLDEYGRRFKARPS
ncbi:MAG TPA: cupin domain-containing protein [Chloroflexota bacterium]|nr:cupin domain-containing protein [Chloroflexota bacterium]